MDELRDEPVGDDEDPGDAGAPDPLLRALEELRALDIERRAAPITGDSSDEITRRVEEKAREVFRIAEQTEDPEPPPSGV